MITSSHYMIDSNLGSQRIDSVFSHWSFLRFGDDSVETKSATVERLLVHGAHVILVLHSCKLIAPSMIFYTILNSIITPLIIIFT